MFGNSGGLQRDNSISVSLQQMSQYRRYLTVCELTPNDIIRNPITLVEHTHSGKGLKSFLEVLINWGIELRVADQLKKSIHVHILVGEDMLSHHCPRTHPDSLLIKSGQKTKGAFLVEMSNSADDLDRLIPHYASYEWVTPPNFSGLNQDGISLISSRIADYCSGAKT